MKHVDPPIRYKIVEVPITLWESIQHFLAALIFGKLAWKRTANEFKEVKPHERGYNTAPYELLIIGKRQIRVPTEINEEYTTPEK